MAYVALYRAYRPQNFKECVGQEHIIKTLQNAIKLNKVAHAYLFCGPRGTGKTTLAKIMAKAMNCVNGPTPEPCCECEICQGIAKGTISDVVEIDAASNNGADDIRALRETVKYLPAQGKYKVYIIDEVHMLSNAAFNALLKTLEEPPRHVIFILATTEPYKLPKTILSRCQRFDFSSIDIDDILKRLRIVAQEENIKITDDALHQIAISAEGGMRDALSLFDQCISYSVNPEITLDDVLAISGNISYIKMIDLLSKCYDNDSTGCILDIDKIIKEGKEVPRIINDLILFLRDLLMFKNNATLDDKLMYKNEDFISLSKKVSKSIIYSWLDILNNSLNQMRFSTQKRAYIELAILKMSDAKVNDFADIIDRVESLEMSVNDLQKNQKNQYNNQRNSFPSFSNNSGYMSSDDLRRLRQEPVNNPEPIINTFNEIKQEPVVNISEVNNNQEEIKVENNVANPFEHIDTSSIEKVPDDEINIHDVEKVLNNASRDNKVKLEAIFKQIENKYSDLATVQILIRGSICAVSEDSFLIALADNRFCNRIMKYECYQKIIEILSEYDINIKDYLCITRESWEKIKVDFKNKYSPSNPKPSLEEMRLYVKRRVTPEFIEDNKNTEVDEAKNLFGDDLVILED
ncbi:MAG: DNA polymerase III subunit gamma/tau [Acholeplasmatales bacterium]|nr:DNA polymerase III subunit gamma/tau [Acholeplasmatales bacterium]